MSNKTRDDDYELPNFDDSLMDKDARERSRNNSESKGKFTFILDDAFFASSNKKNNADAGSGDGKPEGEPAEEGPDAGAGGEMPKAEFPAENPGPADDAAEAEQPPEKAEDDSFNWIDAEPDEDPEQVGAVLSALKHKGRDGEPRRKSQSPSRKKEPDAKQVKEVLAALKAAKKTTAKKANEPDAKEKEMLTDALVKELQRKDSPLRKELQRERQKKGGARRGGESEAIAETQEKYLPVWVEKRKKKKEQALQKQQPPEPVERVTPTIGRRLRSDQVLVYDSELDDIDYTDDEDLPEARDYMPIRFRRYGRVGIAGGILYALFVISVSIVLACAAWMMASDVLAMNKDELSAVVTIESYEPTEEDTIDEKGYAVDEDGNEILVDIDQVANALKNAGLIEYKWLFKIYSQLSSANTKIDPGTYDLSTELDYRALVTSMHFGSSNQEESRVTFPEGYTVAQIFELLEENNICKVEDLEEAAANYEFDYDFLSGLEMGDASRLEGYLFPDTYDFYQGESAAVAISRFLNNTKNKLTEEMEEQAASMGYSMHDIIIIASLIEKEAGSDDDRPIIASIIYNRLNAGWALGIDSTINYILGTNTLNLSAEDLEIDSPYNTYLYTGLPAGPICNPGMASIEAALNPASTNYWYWYSYQNDEGDWVTAFFSTSEEFNSFRAEHPIS